MSNNEQLCNVNDIERMNWAMHLAFVNKVKI